MTDDSEEVFRRAADGYPLKTDNPDWEAVLKKMERNPPSSDKKSNRKKESYRFLWLLLLVIPLAVIEHNYHIISNRRAGDRQEAGKISAATKLKERNEMEKNGPVSAIALHKTAASTVIDGNNTATTRHDANSGIPIKKAFAPANRKTNAGTGAQEKNQIIIINNKPGNLLSSSQNKNSPAATANTTGETRNRAHKTNVLVSKQHTNVRIISAELADDQMTGIVSAGENDPVANEHLNTENKPAAPAIMAKEAIAEKKSRQETKPAEKETAKTAGNKASEKEKKSRSGQKHFYAGIIAGPDLSSIKLQAVKKTGFNFGLVAGYRISSRFSIETGFLKDKKFYGSQGKYFSTKNIPVYPSTTIEQVTGACNMFEVPLNVNYVFSKKARSAWFGSAGISSYFMQKESYVFDVKRYGTIYPYAADYKKHDNQFAAVINISAGYTHKLGKIGDLRVQPYIKIPVNKMGTGELPIQSAGILIGITKGIF